MSSTAPPGAAVAAEPSGLRRDESIAGTARRLELVVPALPRPFRGLPLAALLQHGRALFHRHSVLLLVSAPTRDRRRDLDRRRLCRDGPLAPERCRDAERQLGRARHLRGAVRLYHLAWLCCGTLAQGRPRAPP